MKPNKDKGSGDIQTPSTIQCPTCGDITISEEQGMKLSIEVDRQRKHDVLTFILHQTDIPKKYRDIINDNFWELLGD